MLFYSRSFVRKPRGFPINTSINLHLPRAESFRIQHGQAGAHIYITSEKEQGPAEPTFRGRRLLCCTRHDACFTRVVPGSTVVRGCFSHVRLAFATNQTRVPHWAILEHVLAECSGGGGIGHGKLRWQTLDTMAAPL